MNNEKRILKMCQILTKDFPNPQTELNFTNNFTLLVAIILSAQATDKMVNIVTMDLFKIIQNPNDVIKLGITKLSLYINRLNYYNSKTKHIFNTANIIKHQYNSVVPNSFDSLITLPGVGRKTANVFLNIAYKMPIIAVDTHVFRLTNRIFGQSFIKLLEVEIFLSKITPKKYKINLHHILILHGRYVCKARKPGCQNCSIIDFCKQKFL